MLSWVQHQERRRKEVLPNREGTLVHWTHRARIDSGCSSSSQRETGCMHWLAEWCAWLWLLAVAVHRRSGGANLKFSRLCPGGKHVGPANSCVAEQRAQW